MPIFLFFSSCLRTLSPRISAAIPSVRISQRHRLGLLGTGLEVVQPALIFPSRLRGHWSDKMPVMVRKENCRLINFKSASATNLYDKEPSFALEQ